MKGSLDDAERQLAEYRRDSGVAVLGDEAQAMIAQISRYEEQRAAARLQVDAFSQIGGALGQRQVNPNQFLVGEVADPVLAGLSSGLAQAQQDLTGLQQRFTDNAPAVHELQAKVEAQVGMVKQYVHSRHVRAKQQLDSLNQIIGQFEARLRTVPNAQLELARLTRNTEVLRKMYAFLMERQQQAMVTKASTISKNHVLDAALVPRREDAPVFGIRIAAALVLGLLLGTGGVLVRHASSDAFPTRGALRRELGDLPILATLPRRPAPAPDADDAAALDGEEAQAEVAPPRSTCSLTRAPRRSPRRSATCGPTFTRPSSTARTARSSWSPRPAPATARRCARWPSPAPWRRTASACW